MDKKYKNLEDVLSIGEHKIKVFPKNEWKDGQKVEGSHKHGQSAKGFKWWMYSTKVGDEYISVFANEDNKVLFDSGEVVAKVVQKFDQDTGEPRKKIWFNPSDESVKEYKGKVITKAPSVKQIADEVFDVPSVSYKSTVNPNDIPF